MASVAGGCYEYCAARGPEDAVSQDQDGRHQRDAVGGDPPHPEPGIHVTPFPEHLLPRLTLIPMPQISCSPPQLIHPWHGVTCLTDLNCSLRRSLRY